MCDQDSPWMDSPWVMDRGDSFGEADVCCLLAGLGEDPTREGLRETPRRFIEAWKFWTSGYSQSPEEVLKSFEDGAEGCDEMVFQGGIPFYTNCEHHLVPFFGYAHLAYIPDGKIVGLSKLARLVEIFARRLQTQERLTNQVAETLFTVLGCRGVAVLTQARHLCMESRGVQKVGTVTVCSALRGTFKEHHEVRSEFMSLVQVAMQGIRTL